MARWVAIRGLLAPESACAALEPCADAQAWHERRSLPPALVVFLNYTVQRRITHRPVSPGTGASLTHPVASRELGVGLPCATGDLQRCRLAQDRPDPVSDKACHAAATECQVGRRRESRLPAGARLRCRHPHTLMPRFNAAERSSCPERTAAAAVASALHRETTLAIVRKAGGHGYGTSGARLRWLGHWLLSRRARHGTSRRIRPRQTRGAARGAGVRRACVVI